MEEHHGEEVEGSLGACHHEGQDLINNLFISELLILLERVEQKQLHQVGCFLLLLVVELHELLSERLDFLLSEGPE